MHKKGFTLAEVLITLSIIGVVAALTIPSVVRNYEKTTLRNSFKKRFSELAQVTLMIKADNSDSLLGFYTDPPGSEVSDDDVRNKYLAHMPYIQKCNESSSGCWHAANQWNTLNGNPVNDAIGYTSRAVLKNGALVAFNSHSMSCTYSRGGFSDVCAFIYVDVNGFKGPNTVGRDIFWSWVTDKGLVPVGAQGDSYAPSCGPAKAGWACAAWVLQNIDYDY